MGKTHTGAREKREEEGAAENCYELAATPHSPSPLDHRRGRRGEIEELGMKLSLGKRLGWGEGVIIFVFLTVIAGQLYHSPSSTRQGKKNIMKGSWLEIRTGR